MSDLTPFFLHEAVISLIPALPDGTSIGTTAAWMGACANGLRLNASLDEMRIQGSGAPDPVTYHIGEMHELEIERTWLVRKSNYSDFRLSRNQCFRLEIVWNSGGYWYKRTYKGVTVRTINEQSQRTNHTLLTQSLRANRMVESGGSGPPDIFTPFDESGLDIPVAFFLEEELVQDEYLLGHYRWAVPVTIISAKAVAWASQGSDTVLELEVGGALTGHELTLAAGSVGAEVSDETNISENVTAGESVRWKITSAPSSPNEGSHVAIIMQCRLTV